MVFTVRLCPYLEAAILLFMSPCPAVYASVSRFFVTRDLTTLVLTPALKNEYVDGARFALS